VEQHTPQTAVRLGQTGQDAHDESYLVARARRALELLVQPDRCRRAELHQGLFADDFVLEFPARGGCQVYTSLERGEFRRGTVEILESVESGSRVISHVRFDVERQHEVDGAPVTQECRADGIVTFEFEGDLIAKAWSMLRWR